jgi:hypothetical protein
LGEIWVTLPPEFILDASDITCRSSDFWANGSPNCTQSYDTVKLGGQSSDYVGNLLVYIENIQNPLTELNSKIIIVKTFDGLNKKIIDRSYFNLNPNRF